MSEEQNTRKNSNHIFDDLVEKSKAFADKAEDIFEENLEKVKKSETFGKASRLIDQVGDFVEERVDEFHNGEMGTKFETYKTKAEEQAEDIYEKTKSTLNLLADDVEEAVGKVKAKFVKKDKSTKE